MNSIYALHSKLQKAIRRGNERDALEAAWELDTRAGVSHSRSTGGSMWSIIRRSCAEDCDELNVFVAIETLWHFWEKQVESRDNRHEPWRLFTFKAVLLLIDAKKHRIVDNALQEIPPGKLEKIAREFQEAGVDSYKIPGYAKDGIHTDGPPKTKAEFIVEEDAACNPRSVRTEDPYMATIREALRDEHS